jgi:transposase
MRQRDKKAPQSAEETVREIRRATGRPFSVKEKIRLMLVGLRSEVSIAELCRREGIAESLYCNWSTEFLEAGTWRPGADDTTPREASRSASGVS